MVIVFVIDNYKAVSNGTSITAQRFKKQLEEMGHEVRILTNEMTGDNIYTLKTRYIPLVSRVSKKQDVTFAKPNKKIIEEALKGAEIVHLFMPWKLSKVTMKIAKKNNIPVTTAFHASPESIIYGAKLRFFESILTPYLFKKFRRFYKKAKHVHCPSTYISNQLKKYKYPNQFHVISNGIDESFVYQENKKNKEKFNIIMIGRFAPEKNQSILIKAISLSQYKDKIKLTLAGKGPDEAKLKHLIKKYNIDAHLEFYSKEALIQKIYEQDLYVHTSIIEIEGISCIEAISCGRVPLIADSKDSATPQFALDDRSIYSAHDVHDLVKKIDYWIEHDEERHQMEEAYAKYSRTYKIEDSVKRFLEMLKQATFDYKNETLIKTERKTKVHRRIARRKVTKTISKTFYYSMVPLLILFNKAYLRAKIKNKKHLKNIHGGAVLVSNHVHTLDSVLSGIAAFPRSVVFTGLQENFELPYAGKLVRAFGTVPIPETVTENKMFFTELSKRVRKGQFVHFFPEGELIIGDQTIREFKRGAFKLAVESSAPIVPIRVNFIKRANRRKKRIVVNVGKPIYPNCVMSPKMAIDHLKGQVEQAIEYLA